MEKDQPFQVSFEMTNPKEFLEGQIAGCIQNYMENQFDASIDHIIVRPGWPIGCRQLPTGQIEPLSSRLQFILDFVDEIPVKTGRTQAVNDAARELRELLADVKKAEGIE